MRYQILIALLLSTACGVEGIEVRKGDTTLGVLNFAQYATGPGGPDYAEGTAYGDGLALHWALGPSVYAPSEHREPCGGGGEPCRVGSLQGHPVAITLKLGDKHLTSAGPRLGDGIWISGEGIEIGVEDSQGYAIEGQLPWSGPITP